MLTFQLSQHGQPIQEIGPYLGAFGQVTVFEVGKPYRYFWLQPQSDRQPEDGRLQFKGVFPEAGVYRLYAEFNIAGSIKAFPFVIQVQPAVIEKIVPTTRSRR